MTEQTTAYIALGSNIDPKIEHLSRAINLLKEHPSIDVTDLSAVYETVPKGYDDQDDFLNMVIAVQTSLKPLDLLAVCQGIEGDLKRVRKIKNGPRTIDLDIIMYGQVVSDQVALILPHPRMQDRGFVLYPLADIASDVVVPCLNMSVLDLRNSLSDSEKADVRKSKLII